MKYDLLAALDLVDRALVPPEDFLERQHRFLAPARWRKGQRHNLVFLIELVDCLVRGPVRRMFDLESRGIRSRLRLSENRTTNVS